MTGFFNNSLIIHWTQNSEHDNFAPSVAGIPPGLNTDLSVTPATVHLFWSQVKIYSRSILWKTAQSKQQINPID
jgi:hypothetical protein